jgi:hypothetical protein
MNPKRHIVISDEIAKALGHANSFKKWFGARTAFV